MKTITNYIREHLYEICGLYNKQIKSTDDLSHVKEKED